MEKLAATALLLTALLLPVVSYWLLRSRSRLHGLAAAAIAVAAGWACNVAWAFVSQGTATGEPSPVDGDTLSIAIRFGWACPTVLVFLTWLVWRFKTRRTTQSGSLYNPVLESDAIDIPGFGSVTKDAEYGWYNSQPIAVPVLGGQACRIVLDGYDEDPGKNEYHVAIRNFLSLDAAALQAVESYVYQYYQDCNDNWEPDDDEYLDIGSPAGVWAHVRFGDQAFVRRRSSGDKGIYVSLECNCDWEIEHGLQIVFRNGLKVNKIGPYDGHLTNADAYADASLEDVIYR